jgi:PAT family beta-lactamase induction signal transducer AmpG
MLFLGFSSGLPLLLVFSTLSFWLKDVGVSLATIGAFALVKTPYTFKLIWAPFMDKFRVPYLAHRLGHRRSWALVAQALLIGSIFLLGLSNPAQSPWLTAWAAVAVAFFSASQDIVLDAYRVERLTAEQQGAGSAVFVLGYRLALLVAGAGALYMADAMPWPQVYTIIALIQGIGIITILLCREPDHPQLKPVVCANFIAWVNGTLLAPFRDFTLKDKWYLILLFVATYKLGDAFLGVMANPFYIEVGFSKIQIANVSKLYGLIATIIGGLIGGTLVAKLGLFRALLLGAFVQLASNLMFAWLAYVGNDINALVLTITVENLSGGVGSAAFVAYFAYLCNREYTATQYALLTSIMSFARDGLAATSGLVAERVDWVSFFLMSTAVAIPGILILLTLTSTLKKEAS